jgi:hypothetical protein
LVFGRYLRRVVANILVRGAIGVEGKNMDIKTRVCSEKEKIAVAYEHKENGYPSSIPSFASECTLTTSGSSIHKSSSSQKKSLQATRNIAFFFISPRKKQRKKKK